MNLSHLKSDRRLSATAASAAVWLACMFDWLWVAKIPQVALGIGFGVAAVAAVVTATAPLFVLIMIFQRQLVSGLTAGAVKG